jgi:hypothetical protein
VFALPRTDSAVLLIARSGGRWRSRMPDYPSHMREPDHASMPTTLAILQA